MKASIILVSVLLLLAPVAIAQDCGDRCIENPDPGGDGSGGSGCLYCYSSSAPYANCFSGASGLGYPRYANCQGGRTCWTDGNGQTYCEPHCFGSECFFV